MARKCLSGTHRNYVIGTTVKTSIASCFLEFETVLNEQKEEWVWPPTVNTHTRKYANTRARSYPLGLER